LTSVASVAGLEECRWEYAWSPLVQTVFRLPRLPGRRYAMPLSSLTNQADRIFQPSPCHARRSLLAVNIFTAGCVIA
jgi:hypothetical protein